MIEFLTLWAGLTAATVGILLVFAALIFAAEWISDRAGSRAASVFLMLAASLPVTVVMYLSLYN